MTKLRMEAEQPYNEVKSYKRDITMGGDSQVLKEQQKYKCALKAMIRYSWRSLLGA